MSERDFTTNESAKVLRILMDLDRPIVAADIASRLYLTGQRETQRRKIRAIIKYLRDNCGAKIVATLCGGYMITSNEAIWKDYLEGKQIDAKRIIGETAKKKRMIADKKGQGFLFMPKMAVGLG